MVFEVITYPLVRIHKMLLTDRHIHSGKVPLPSLDRNMTEVFRLVASFYTHLHCMAGAERWLCVWVHIYLYIYHLATVFAHILCLALFTLEKVKTLSSSIYTNYVCTDNYYFLDPTKKNPSNYYKTTLQYMCVHKHINCLVTLSHKISNSTHYKDSETTIYVHYKK